MLDQYLNQQAKTMYRGLLVTSLIIAIVLGSTAWAQTRSLSGRLSLDIGPSDIDRTVMISVRNHSFLVLPTFTILRPITSIESTTVTLATGSASVDYVINDIIADPIDYSISIECIACSNNLPTQYYSPEGNRFGLSNSVYIDPDELPNVLNLMAITRASISGDITLDRIADRALNFRVTVFSIDNPNISYKVLSSITLVPGMSTTSYSVSGINRAIGTDRYGVRLQCINCFGASKRAQVYDGALSPSENHSSINFFASDERAPTLAPIIDLIIE